MKIGFFGLLALLLTGLKLGGIITISWGWVVFWAFMPLILAILFVLLVIACTGGR